MKQKRCIKYVTEVVKRICDGNAANWGNNFTHVTSYRCHIEFRFFIEVYSGIQDLNWLHFVR